MSLEEQIAKKLMGEGGPSLLKTDGYKFSMAQAGFPLREEDFVLALRKGGPYYIPFDLTEIVQHLIPVAATGKEQGFLQAHGYGMTPAMEQALKGKIKVWAAPKDSWVLGKEPIMRVSGPSFLASWLEPLDIMLQMLIQVATAYKLRGIEGFPVMPDGRRGIPTVCNDERALLDLLAECMEVPPFSLYNFDQQYREGVYKNAVTMVEAVKGDAHRIFEVGLRAATCMQQHMIALKEIRRAGIDRTSNVWGAWKLYMIPVGTTGHEHQERWGNDFEGFCAIEDMRPEPPSFLFDTNDPINIGIPTAMKVIRRNPDRPRSLRFDSGDQDAQFLLIRRGCSQEIDGVSSLWTVPNLIFEDSYNPEKTAKNEAFCDKWGWPREKRMYGPGGWLISKPHPSPFNRDVASSAYKLAYSNGPRQKNSGSPGKESLTGRPVILRSHPITGKGCQSMIAQEGEEVLGFVPINDPTVASLVPEEGPLFSPETTRLSALMREKREQMARKAKELT